MNVEIINNCKEEEEKKQNMRFHFFKIQSYYSIFSCYFVDGLFMRPIKEGKQARFHVNEHHVNTQLSGSPVVFKRDIMT